MAAVAGGVVAIVLAIIGATILGSAPSVFNLPQTPIGDVLNRVDAGQVKTAVISGERVILIDRAGATIGAMSGTPAVAKMPVAESGRGGRQRGIGH